MEHNLKRFLDAQKIYYKTALEEIKSGRKESHWMWFIFPQIEGLGFSETARFYSIKSKEEAEAYMNNPVLSSNLIKISEALLNCGSDNIHYILGSIDSLKLKSSMTLFYSVKPEIKIFKEVLDKFYDGTMDQKTLGIINC